MADFSIGLEWVDPLDAKAPELRATWARLSLRVGNVSLTRLFDQRLRSVREEIFLPLYPLAEWLAENWWHLFYENVMPGRSTHATFAHRHHLRYAREGFALPELEIRPLGEAVQLDWKALSLPSYGVEFLATGSAQSARSQVRDDFARLIESVLARLEQSDIRQTPLHALWESVVALDADAVCFCRAAAALGLHPYQLDDASEEQILRIGNGLPPALTDGFFEAAEAQTLAAQFASLSLALETIREQKSDLPDLVALRVHLADAAQTLPFAQNRPWQDGYAAARQVRSLLNLEKKRFPSLISLFEALSPHIGPIRRVVLSGFDSQHLFDLLTAVNHRESPGFVIDKNRDDSVKFALCRGLYEYLAADNGDAALVTRAQNLRQMRNRAFAAEFLAPAAALANRINRSFITSEEIDDLSAEFGVSTLVIQHQLQNHNLVTEVIP